ncbi:MAG: hypothetical protein WEA58_13575 [Balneolaceae bacterium]
MEILLLLIIIGVIIYVVSQNSGNQPQRDTPPEFQVNVSTSRRDEYEDPYLGANFNQSNDRHEIFSAPYPFFYALNDNSFISKIEGSLKPIANSLSKISDEDVQRAINTLVDQNYFRTKSGLPKYLQMVPIEKFIRENIFIEPDKNDKDVLLSSMTMKELRKKCNQIDITAARSKAETIEKLINSDKNLGLDYSQYFMINPVIKKLYDHFDKYSLKILDQTFDKNQIKIADVSKKLNKEELEESKEVDNYKIQMYGYRSVIFFKNKKPLFRILEFSLNRYGGFAVAILLKNGILLLNDEKHLGRTRMGLVLLLNGDKEVLFQKRLSNPEPNSLKDIPDQNFIYCNMQDKSIWILNTKTLEDKFLENPEDKDIYSLLEEF